jgi:hypothetical protein
MSAAYTRVAPVAGPTRSSRGCASSLGDEQRAVLHAQHLRRVVEAVRGWQPAASADDEDEVQQDCGFIPQGLLLSVKPATD